MHANRMHGTVLSAHLVPLSVRFEVLSSLHQELHLGFGPAKLPPPLCPSSPLLKRGRSPGLTSA